ncbi:MAG: hypothetical protein Q7U16_12100 [Agitococcus sp.]|jgi:hypothetical protein|nr:hypothetical protein [Agitococcus sp.]
MKININFNDGICTIVTEISFFKSVFMYLFLIFIFILSLFVFNFIFNIIGLSEYFFAFVLVFTFVVFLILSSDISQKGVSIPGYFTFFEINKINKILKVGYGKDRIAKELKIGDFQCLCIYEETIAKATHCCIKLVGKDNDFVIRRVPYGRYAKGDKDRVMREILLWCQPISQWLNVGIKDDIYHEIF